MPLRSPGRYGASSSLAITPSALCSQGSAPRRRRCRWGSGRTSSVERAPRAAARRSSNGRSSSTSSSTREEVEGDEPCRGLGGQALDRASRRMDALLERAELLPAAGVGDHDLAVEHVAPAGRARARGSSAAAACRCATGGGRVAVDEGDRAKAVQLGLVGPAVALGELLPRARQLGEDGGLEGERHAGDGSQRAVRDSRTPARSARASGTARGYVGRSAARRTRASTRRRSGEPGCRARRGWRAGR